MDKVKYDEFVALMEEKLKEAATPKDLVMYSSIEEDAIYYQGLATAYQHALEMLPKFEGQEWRAVDYSTLKEGEYLCLLKSFNDNYAIKVMKYFDTLDDANWLLDGCEISNAWDVVRVRDLPPLPQKETGR